MTTRKNLRLASFDAGGVRGLSQLEIMNRIVYRLNWDKRSNGSEPLLPCEHFDLIGGSGTGGLIAIMFAKLRMTVEEVIEEFDAIVELYNQTDITPEDRTQGLKAYLEGIMERKQLPIDMKLVDGTQVRGCACFVVASTRTDTGSPLCLRSYPMKGQAPSAVTVVEAVLATCVAQPMFAPFPIGVDYERKEYIGAGLGANNPINEVITEAHSLFGPNSTVSSLLSVGIGHPGVIALPSDGDEVNLFGALQAVMNDCTERAREIKQKIGRAGIYHRFSVEQGMQNSRGSQAMDPEWIFSQAETYMQEQEQLDRLEAFAENYKTQINPTNLGELKSGKVKPMLPAYVDMVKAGDTGPVVILEKLKPSDLQCEPIVEECMEGTRQDVLSSILDWASDFKAPNIFWVEGHPGVGKSAISVTLKEELQKSGRLGSSFFFQRERANVQTPNALWRAVAYDLASKYPTIRKRLLIALNANKALSTASNTEKLFQELIHGPLMACDDFGVEGPPVIVIDALDECGGSDGRHSEHRERLCQTLQAWSTLPRQFKLVVTSRGEADLQGLFSTIAHVPLEVCVGTAVDPHSLEDIKKFFEQEFRRVRNRYQSELPADWPGSSVIQELTSKSEGLFIWAKTIIGFLKQGEPQQQLSRILAGTGAGGMAALYCSIFKMAFPHPSEKILKEFRTLVGTIIVAKDPLPVSSLMDSCSIDSSTMNYIRGNLQSVMTSGDVLQFQHSSIIDFLTDAVNCPPEFLIKPVNIIKQVDCSEKLALECRQATQEDLQFDTWVIEPSGNRNNDIQSVSSKIEERIPPSHRISSPSSRRLILRNRAPTLRLRSLFAILWKKDFYSG